MPPLLPSSLTPHVVVYSTPELTDLLSRHNLPPLHHILQTYSPLSQVITRTTALVPVTHPAFPLRFSDLQAIESACKEDEESRATRTIDWIGARISRKSSGWVENLQKSGKGEPLSIAAGETRWWDELKSCVDGDRTPERGEGWSHPVALILATSTLHPNALQAVTNLQQRVAELPVWIDPHMMRYTLIVHPTGMSNLSQDEAVALFNATKKQYGLHTHLLPLTLSPPTTTKPLIPLPPQLPPPSLFPMSPEKELRRPPVQEPPTPTPPLETLNLSDEDTVNTNRFIREFVVQSLVPWMERSVVEWNEAYSSTRRLPSRLFSSTRRLFGSSNPSSNTNSGFATPVASPTASVGSLPFGRDSVQPLAQQRRLAEFATFLGDYKLAVPLWESIRKEGKGGSDILPLLLAPSLTLEAHAAYALSPLTTVPSASSQLRALKYAVRWEQGVLDFVNLRGEKWLVWAASTNQEDEPSSGILLAQAALIALRKGNRRTAAMWYVSAARRLEKCGIKSLTVYFLKTAYDLLKLPPQKNLSPSFDEIQGEKRGTVGFDAIMPSIEHSLGRLKYGIGDVEGAIEFFLGLLKGSPSGQGESGEGDKVYLDDFRVAFEHLKRISDSGMSFEDLSLPVPLSQPSLCKIRFSGDSSGVDEEDSAEWNVMEEHWTTFWKTTPASKKEGVKRSGGAEVGEPFWVELVLKNPLDTEVVLSDVAVKAKEISAGESGTEEAEITVESIPTVTISARAKTTVSVKVVVNKVTTVQFTHATFNFLGLVPISEPLSIKGKRLNDTIAHQRSVAYAKETYLHANVKHSGGRLKIEFLDEGHGEMTVVQGELKRTRIRVKNVGGQPVEEIWCMINEEGISAWIDIENTEKGEDEESQNDDEEEEEEEGDEEIDDDEDEEEGEEEDEKRENDGTTMVSTNSLKRSDPIKIPISRILGDNAHLESRDFLDLNLVFQSHATGSGKLSALFIFREREDSTTFLTTFAQRSFEVETLLDVVAAVRPSASFDQGYTLHLELENVGSVGDIVLTQVTTLSPAWSCASFTTGVTKLMSNVIPERQVERVFGKLRHAEGDTAGAKSSAEFLNRKLGGVLLGEPLERSDPPSLRLLVSQLGKAESPMDVSNGMIAHLLQSTRQQRLNLALQQQFPFMPPDDFRAIFPLYNAHDLDVILVWNIPSSDRRGFMLLSGLTIGPRHSILDKLIQQAGSVKKTRSMYAETAREKEVILGSVKECGWNKNDDPIVVNARTSGKVSHDFAKG
ncbi:hypothetical protein FRC02_009995 [Tulasnella sp. 418]|nr:hypothetical protein FRC02_009995 [Tulasnella sp. 418]